MQDASGNGGCCQIDEDTIELHAMGRLKSGAVSEHLDQCCFCRDRVAEYRSYLIVLKHGLGAFLTENHGSGLRDADGGSRSGEYHHVGIGLRGILPTSLRRGSSAGPSGRSDGPSGS
jgi:hypothetical protein